MKNQSKCVAEAQCLWLAGWGFEGCGFKPLHLWTGYAASMMMDGK